MTRNIIGIPACTKLITGYIQHATPARYGAALIAASHGVPVLIPPEGEAVLPLLDHLDGIMFNGSLSNVAPMRYGADFDATPDAHDPERDATTLPLIHAGLAMGGLADGTARPMAVAMLLCAAAVVLAASLRPRLTYSLENGS